MKFYSGFSLTNEQDIFNEYISDNIYTVSGFSYGAILAFNQVLQNLEEGKRVDTLQLFSPAFFQTRDKKFKRLQLMSYKKNQSAYIKEFTNSCFHPYTHIHLQRKETNIHELTELLEYEWSKGELLAIEKKGVNIEVYLGGKDSIIDVDEARSFFLEVSTLTYIKNANHFLQTNNIK